MRTLSVHSSTTGSQIDFPIDVHARLTREKGKLVEYTVVSRIMLNNKTADLSAGLMAPYLSPIPRVRNIQNRRGFAAGTPCPGQL